MIRTLLGCRDLLIVYYLKLLLGDSRARYFIMHWSGNKLQLLRFKTSLRNFYLFHDFWYPSYPFFMPPWAMALCIISLRSWVESVSTSGLHIWSCQKLPPSNVLTSSQSTARCMETNSLLLGSIYCETGYSLTSKHYSVNKNFCM